MKSPEHSLGVELPNRTWDGVVGVIARGDADVSTVGLAATAARMGVVDFLWPIAPLK